MTGKRVAGLAAAIAGFLIVVGVEVVNYPRIATITYRQLTGHGWDGSGLAYFQLFYVLPAACVFAAAALLAMWLLRKTFSRVVVAIVSAYALDLVLLFGSIAYYRSLLAE